MSTGMTIIEQEPQGETRLTTAAEEGRVSQEVQAQVVMAKRFPRDETAAAARILKACKRRSLAEQSQYSYTKGGTSINGPSIRLAEAMAQAWGNLDFGWQELERRPGESLVEAFCWDIETNTRRKQKFTVKHMRDTRSGGKPLKDEREIYEHIANQASRRLRACILSVIPGDVADDAVAECNKTMQGNNSEPIADRVKKMLVAYDEHGVSQAMIEDRLNHSIDAVNEIELANLRKWFTAIKDGVARRDDLFNVNAGKPESDKPKTAEDLKKKHSKEEAK